MSFDESLVRHVNIGYTKALFDYLRDIGSDPCLIAAPNYVERVDQLDSFARCSLHEWDSLMARAEVILGDPDLALKVSRAIKPWHTGLVGFMIMTSRALGDVGGVLMRFEHLLNDVNHVTFEVNDQAFMMYLQTSANARSRRLALLSIGSWAWHSRWLTGQPDLIFDAHFEYEEPADIEIYRQTFGGDVRFNQRRNVFVGGHAYLELRVIQQDPNINRVLRKAAFEQLEALSNGHGNFLARLEKAIKMRLESARLSLEDVASDMNVAPRTLQNRLTDYGMSFRSLVDGIRRAQAKTYLDVPHLSISEIALMLGFSTQTSFQHAFKRWTGQTPGSYRRKALPATPPDADEGPVLATEGGPAAGLSKMSTPASQGEMPA
jgi:AraC-like DNA-binding protein